MGDRLAVGTSPRGVPAGHRAVAHDGVLVARLRGVVLGKLGAVSRREAAARAAELGVLDAGDR